MYYSPLSRTTTILLDRVGKAKDIIPQRSDSQIWGSHSSQTWSIRPERILLLRPRKLPVDPLLPEARCHPLPPVPFHRWPSCLRCRVHLLLPLSHTQLPPPQIVCVCVCVCVCVLLLCCCVCVYVCCCCCVCVQLGALTQHPSLLL